MRRSITSPVKKRVYRESSEAASLIKWCSLYPEVSTYIFHIPNEGKRTLFQHIRLLKEGLRVGIPDYFYAYPCKDKHGLFIELKSRKGRITMEQKAMLAVFSSVGYGAVVAKGWEEAARAIQEYRSDLRWPKI